MNELVSGFISRDKAIEALSEENVTVKGMRAGKQIIVEYSNKLREGYIDILRKVPDAEVVPDNHGRWLTVGKTGRGTPVRKCSSCGMERAGRPKSKYCPDCGCHMDLTIVDSIDGQQTFTI